MNKMTYRIGIEAVYRRSALNVISAFRTVSADAAVVIAGTMLLRLVVDMKRQKCDKKRGIAYDAMDKWQQDWANSYKGSNGSKGNTVW